MTVRDAVKTEMAKRPPLPELSQLKTLRKKAGLTQQAVADIVVVSREMISAYETGRAEPTGECRLRYIEALDVMRQETAP